MRRRGVMWPAVALAAVAVLAACSAPGAPGASGTEAAHTAATSNTATSSSAARTDAGALSMSIGGMPAQADLERARRDADRLQTRRLAAQLVVPRRENDVASAAALTQEVGFGGAVLFAEHVPTDQDTIVSTVSSANDQIARAVASDREWPAFIAVDQEGGPIQRLGAPLTQFPSAMALGAAGEANLARGVAAASGSELAALGFTVVLAPDADVTSGPNDPTIGVRSAGSDPGLVSRVAVAYAQGYADAGLVSSSKHFPGHGSVTGDTHVGSVRQRADLETLLRHDLRPFRDLVEAGAPALMTAHIVLDAVDRTAPATLSSPVLTGLLRERLGFEGLIITDALEMGAVTKDAGAGEAAVRAVEAGADVLLMPTDPRAAAVALAQAVDSGRLSRDRLLDSAARMIATLRHAAERAQTAPVMPASTTSQQAGHAELAVEVARASITQLTGACGARLVDEGILVAGGSEGDRDLLNAAAREAGLRVGEGTRVMLIGGGVYRAAENAPGTAASSATAGAEKASAGGVSIALDVPYPLGSAPGITLAAFGRTPATFSALVEVLTGQREARGALPVAVGSKPVGYGCAASNGSAR